MGLGDWLDLEDGECSQGWMGFYFCLVKKLETGVSLRWGHEVKGTDFGKWGMKEILSFRDIDFGDAKVLIDLRNLVLWI